ncbi:hypothetical protein HYP58_gp91 [Vibrio phage 1.097.O._10N.286.49.B3]|uniref:Uncharacterized protein n=1 Tax=Vibrio phage 1.097.O._10N.286.49.B3 TaxID=1881383 RepID=A0A2I7R0R3_9CAUD|nr:hypothetical protein HYP58_gp91 [Vibrio phage 1.097.O._10N.286.49.B3]AUR87237.1 hypothetical protein NVP1097O_91 [Vibrio phage 1.097.O._10N.286.49.B3]
MARKTSTSRATTNSNFKPADAFLRLEVVDTEGNKHRLPKDMAMHLEKHIHEMMINAQMAADEKGSEPIEFKLVGTVHVVDNAPKGEVKFA